MEKAATIIFNATISALNTGNNHNVGVSAPKNLHKKFACRIRMDERLGSCPEVGAVCRGRAATTSRMTSS